CALAISASGAGGAEAAVDVDHFTGGRGEPVREQGDDGLARRGGVGLVPAQGRTVAPHVLEGSEAGDRGGGGGLERAGRDQVDAHAVLTDVFGEVAGGGFEGGLGHAHPVVDGPGDRRVEGQSHNSGALVEHGLGGHGDRLERVRG